MSTCRAVPTPVRERRVKGVPFPSAATPTPGPPSLSGWALIAAHTAKFWGMGPREQEGVILLQFWSKCLDLERVFAGAGCNLESLKEISPICSLQVTCCIFPDHWQLI